MARTLLVYDDRQLQELFHQLDQKEQVRAMRGAFRPLANKFRKSAIANLKGSRLPGSKSRSGDSRFHYTPDMADNVRAVVYKKMAGFRVTVGTVGRTKGFHRNRYGLDKPVLMWAEDGTAMRMTKSNEGRTRRFSRRKRGMHSSGRMPALKFMLKTKYQLAGQMTDDMQVSIRKYVIRAAKRHGCRV